MIENQDLRVYSKIINNCKKMLAISINVCYIIKAD